MESKVKQPNWEAFHWPETVSVAGGAKSLIKRRRPVFLRLAGATVMVRTFSAEGDKSFLGTVESIAEPPAGGAGIEQGDWVRFDLQHIFSACVSHE